MDLDRHHRIEGAFWASLGVTSEERDVTVGPDRIRHRIQEIGSGPPLVFVHGTSVTGTCFAPLASALRDHRCLLVDRAGCGFSDPVPERMDLAAFQSSADRWVVDVMDAVGLDEATIVSTSFGGYFALRTAAAHPDRVTAVRHMAWSAGAPIAHVPLAMRIGGTPSIGKFMTGLPVPRSVAKSMLRQIGLGGALDAGKISDEFIDWFHSVARDTDTIRNEIHSLPPITSVRAGLNRDLLLDAALLGSIEVPVSFLWGTDDPMGGIDIAETFVARIPGARLEVLAGAGHAPWVDDPNRAAEFVRQARRG
jgi:pimeloyl-ACP methyl ester carboxylesterase